MIDEEFLEGINITYKDTVQTEAYAADIKAEQDAAAAVQTQLDDASKTIQSYKDMDIDGIKQSAKDWETKYTQETQKLTAQLAAQERTHALDMLMGGYKFSSKPAENGVRAEFEKKNFTLEDGKFLGGDEFMKSLMENDDYKGAFVFDDDGEPEDDSHEEEEA